MHGLPAIALLPLWSCAARGQVASDSELFHALKEQDGTFFERGAHHFYLREPGKPDVHTARRGSPTSMSARTAGGCSRKF